MTSLNRLDARELSRTLARDLPALDQLTKIDKTFVMFEIVDKFEGILDHIRNSSLGLTGKLITSANIVKARESLNSVRKQLVEDTQIENGESH